MDNRTLEAAIRLNHILVNTDRAAEYLTAGLVNVSQEDRMDAMAAIATLRADAVGDLVAAHRSALKYAELSAEATKHQAILDEKLRAHMDLEDGPTYMHYSTHMANYRYLWSEEDVPPAEAVATILADAGITEDK